MSVYASTLIVTALLLASLSLGNLTAKSLCQARNWQAEVRRVGETLKDRPGWRIPQIPCRGGSVNWNFQGKLHE